MRSRTVVSTALAGLGNNFDLAGAVGDNLSAGAFGADLIAHILPFFWTVSAYVVVERVESGYGVGTAVAIQLEDHAFSARGRLSRCERVRAHPVLVRRVPRRERGDEFDELVPVLFDEVGQRLLVGIVEGITDLE